MKVGRGSHQPLESIGHDSFREYVRTYPISKGLPDLFRIGFQTFGFVSRYSTYPSKVHPCGFPHFPPVNNHHQHALPSTSRHVLHCVLRVVWIYFSSSIVWLMVYINQSNSRSLLISPCVSSLPASSILLHLGHLLYSSEISAL